VISRYLEIELEISRNQFRIFRFRDILNLIRDIFKGVSVLIWLLYEPWPLFLIYARVHTLLSFFRLVIIPLRACCIFWFTQCLNCRGVGGLKPPFVCLTPPNKMPWDTLWGSVSTPAVVNDAESPVCNDNDNEWACCEIVNPHLFFDNSNTGFTQ
jgi:hypothetical protein